MDEIKNNNEVSEVQKINEGAEALTKNLGATDGTTLSDADIDAFEKQFDSKIDGTLNKNDGTDHITSSADGVNQQLQNNDGQANHHQSGRGHFSPSFGFIGTCSDFCRQTETKMGYGAY